ncbi:hypothetical protein GCM10010252_77800 [Streptomyces aureoverticillatus]|nr:hypothetical protein GCM10010252_77800 [Streptomyces aureoverticillatus]
MIGKREEKLKLLKEFHDSLWAGYRGIWVIFVKLKERYWWKNMYRDVFLFVELCEIC